MKKKFLVFFLATIVVVVIGVAIKKKGQVDNKYQQPILVSPISEEWVEKEGEEFLRVTYGDTVLEIPKKYNPGGITRKTKTIYLHLVWPGMTPDRRSENDIYTFTVYFYPHNSLSNFDDHWRVENLNKLGYFLRESPDYPSLKEYWNEEKGKSNYFKVTYGPNYLKDFISCSPGYKKSLETKSNSGSKMGDRSCIMNGEISKDIIIKVGFDARLLPEGNKFHKAIDQLITDFIVIR